MIGALIERDRFSWLALAAAFALVFQVMSSPVQADCTDNDGDGYGNPGSADCSNGSATDCNDGNASIHPGAAELCNGVDDDCDGQTDEGFTVFGLNPQTMVVGDLPIGSPCVAGEGICAVEGTVICMGGAAVCDGPTLPPEDEDKTIGDTCFDGFDNDCDGDVDHEDVDCQTAEFCDGFDNDNDGSVDEDFGDLGDTCSVGIGLCVATGEKVCSPDGTTTICNVQALPPGSENTPGVGACTDGQDNDCDGFTDLNDPGCQEPEKCDGLDNDGDGTADEDFADLGDPCTTGVGACESSGNQVCSANGLATVCDAVEKLGSPEGPSGATCTDGIDNDCDGFTDMDDLGCSSSNLGLSVALRRIGEPDGAGPGPDVGPLDDDCEGWHQVLIDFDAAQFPGAVLTKNLVLYDTQGNELLSLPVFNTQILRLEVQKDLSFFDIRTEDGFLVVVAPLMVLRATVDDGFNRVRAFASPTPYLEVVEPKNVVVSQSQGDVTNVLVAMPLVDPATLTVHVDGVEIITGMGLDPNTDLPGGPFTNNVMINGNNVTVDSLVLRASDVDTPDANTLSMKLRNLGCGSHVFIVQGTPLPGSYPTTPNDNCHLDDLVDTGLSSGFAVEITAPAQGQQVAGGPVHVLGEVCHGMEIKSVSINGGELDVSTQVFTPGDGVTSGDLVTYQIDEMIPVNDLHDELNLGTSSQGTFDPGSNRLHAKAVDNEFNTTYDNVIFSVGPVLPAPGSLAPSVGAASAGEPISLDEQDFKSIRASVVQETDDRVNLAGGIMAAEVQRAFTLALSTSALQTFFSSMCDDVGPDIAGKVEDALREFKNTKKVDAVCDPNVTTRMTSIFVDPNGFSCSITPMQDQFTVRINLPTISMVAKSTGSCKEKVLGVCVDSLSVDVETSVSIAGMFVEFTVTEASIKTKSQIPLTFDPGTLSFQVIDNDTDRGCIGGFFSDVVGFLLEIFTFGQFDPAPLAESPLTSTDLEAQLSIVDGDPMEVDLVTFDNEQLDAFMLELAAGLGDVQITPNGMAAAIKASIAPTMIDPEVADVPGTPIKDPPLPQPPVPGAGGVTIAINPDLFNQIFAGTTKAGKLKTLFNDVRLLSDFLPADCSTLSDPAEQGRCAAFNGDPCASLPAGDARTTCFATQLVLASRGLSGATPIILRGRVDVPPKIEIDDDPVTPGVEVVLRYSQISIIMIADRDLSGSFDGTLNDLLPCFGDDPSTDTECSLWEACLNLNLFASMTLATGPEGRPAIETTVVAVNFDLSSGDLCGGGVVGVGGETVEESGQGTTVEIINQLVGDTTPPLESEGLDFGGLVQFQNASLIAIENDGDPDFQDYIAITGDLAAAPGPPAPDPTAPPAIRADLDGDGDVDGADFLTFSNCFNGALVPPKPGCLTSKADADLDGDVDVNDFLTFSGCYNGANRPPSCGP